MNKFTKISEDLLPVLDSVKSLLVNGCDTEGNHITVKDALNLPNAGTVFKRAIEEIVLAPKQPLLIGNQLIRTTFVGQAGRSLGVRTLGAVDLFDFFVPEEGEYQEISAARGNGTILELKFQKYGCKLKISEELIENSNWDLITLQMQQVVDAMARYRDKAIFNVLFGRGLVVFDNKEPTKALKNRTKGRDITGAGNGSITMEDLIDMYSVIVQNGYTPDTILCHPLHWSMFAKDPVLRNLGFTGNIDVKSYYDGMVNKFKPETTNLSPTMVNTYSDAERQIMNQSAPTLPAYTPFSGLNILVSPLVPFDPQSQTGDILMLDSNNSAILAISEPLSLTEWDEQHNDIKVIKFREKWAIDIVDNGKAIAIAKNVSFDSNEFFHNPIAVVQNVQPISKT